MGIWCEVRVCTTPLDNFTTVLPYSQANSKYRCEKRNSLMGGPGMVQEECASGCWTLLQDRRKREGQVPARVKSPGGPSS